MNPVEVQPRESEQPHAPARPLPKIRTAVIAAAGLGTRFLPQTKAMPKEMLPIIDKPVIQHIVEELVDAGIQDVVIVTGYHKRSIEDHFDVPHRELVATLTDLGRHDALLDIEAVAELANFIYIRQKGPSGNATPLLNAARPVGPVPFIYTFGDDFIKATPGRFQQMVEVYEQTGLGVLSCVRVQDPADYERYGFVRGRPYGGDLVQIDSIVEKPGRFNAVSDLASVSSYLFPPAILDHLEAERAALLEHQEFLLQSVIQRFIDAGNELLAYEVQNARYHDCGNRLEYLKTVVELGLEHPEMGADFYEHLLEVVRFRQTQSGTPADGSD